MTKTDFGQIIHQFQYSSQTIDGSWGQNSLFNRSIRTRYGT
jgi:hypothetical protein